jgi:hypothetical protein
MLNEPKRIMAGGPAQSPYASKAGSRSGRARGLRPASVAQRPTSSTFGILGMGAPETSTDSGIAITRP